MDTAALRARIDEYIRRHGLIARGGEVVCLVSGGADSTCLWHALGKLGYRTSALHVNHGLRGAASDAPPVTCSRERAGGPRAIPRPTGWRRSSPGSSRAVGPGESATAERTGS